ncbi:PREDICTED: uncharacterized protein LOC106806225 [Priapulus caudatus]|uniref:Uncharacterized protein LOC106806225 n=1 Tax=Priapulus caudatus TaxID=37621 RepID=A0ABM1DUG0_PRICU|nr:PREDICTED: uncharacterized protein LOC106806225 [Priapulus caudatus]
MLPVVAGLQTYGETPPPTNYTYAQPAAGSYTSGQVGGNSYGGVVQTGTYAAGTAAVSVQESPVQNSYAVEQPPATYVRETSPSSGSVSSYDQLPTSYGSRVSAALPTSYGQTPAQATVSAPHIAGQQYDQAATSYAGPSDQRALLTDVRNSYLADISSGHQVVLPDVNRNVVQRYGSGIDNIIRDIDVTCDPLCRSMDIKIDFTSKLPTKIKLVTPGYNPREKNDNCYFEGGNTERAFFGISLFGCGTTELVNDERQLVQYNNVLKLKLENSGEERQYPIACSISSDERVKMISYLGKLLKDRPKNETGPNIAIPNYCLHLSEVKNKLTDLRAGDSCLLNHQCPPHAMCLPYGGIRICQCSMGWTNYGGRCKSVPRDGDVCYTSEDCKREQASYGCSSGQRVCRIRVEVGGHCMDNAECGPPHRYCRADSNTCACNPNSSAARCSEG